MYMGLDLSLKSTGVCLYDPTDGWTHTERIETFKLMGMERLDKVVRRLEELTGGADHYITQCAMEGYALQGQGKNYQIAELGGVVRYAFFKWGLPVIVVTPQHLKMFATGSGNASKVEICEHIKHVWHGPDFLKPFKKNNRIQEKPADWGTRDDDWRNDEADAWVLAHVSALYRNAWGRKDPPTQRQMFVIGEVEIDPHSILSKEAKMRRRGIK